MKCQIPYNYIYGNKILEVIYNNTDLIDSIYFGFENSCRTIEQNVLSLEEHLIILKSIKEKTGIKLAYVLNSIIQKDLSKTDILVLDSGIVDIVIIALDSIFEKVYKLYKNKFEYELSRFYYLVNNKNVMVRYSNYIAFGFEKELNMYWNELRKNNNELKLIYIVNENCYSDCDYKIVHNTNQLERNKGLNIKKFDCPYVDIRRFYRKEDIIKIKNIFPLSIIKICDRAFSDEKLLGELEKWLKFSKEVV